MAAPSGAGSTPGSPKAWAQAASRRSKRASGSSQPPRVPPPPRADDPDYSPARPGVLVAPPPSVEWHRVWDEPSPTAPTSAMAVGSLGSSLRAQPPTGEWRSWRPSEPYQDISAARVREPDLVAGHGRAKWVALNSLH